MDITINNIVVTGNSICHKETAIVGSSVYKAKARANPDKKKGTPQKRKRTTNKTINEVFFSFLFFFLGLFLLGEDISNKERNNILVKDKQFLSIFCDF